MLAPDATEAKVQLDPLSLLLGATLPVKVTVVLLLAASTYVWVIAVLKRLQLARLRSEQTAFEQRAAQMAQAVEVVGLANEQPHTAAARIIAALKLRMNHASSGQGMRDRLEAALMRALADERQRAAALVTPLGTIASVSPFIGLFGTVYGIMDAFVRIGNEKSASLPVVAPAIGEALITTAIGLVCAIPAVAVYNAIDKRLGDYMDALEASAREWVAMFAAHSTYQPPPQTVRQPHAYEAESGPVFPLVR